MFQTCDSENTINNWLVLTKALFEHESLRSNPNFKLTYPIVEILGENRPVGEVNLNNIEPDLSIGFSYLFYKQKNTSRHQKVPTI